MGYNPWSHKDLDTTELLTHMQRNLFILYSEYVVFRGLENVDGEKKKDKMFKNHPRAYQHRREGQW